VIIALVLMKKVACFLLLCLVFLPLQAQDRLSFSVEMEAGGGFGNGPRFVASPQFVAQYEWGNGFKVGAGTGIRYAKPCYYVSYRNGAESREYCDEVDVPIFLRATYGNGSLYSLYACLDAGYSIGGLFIMEGIFTTREHSYNGLFLEPQVGWITGEHSAFVLGILLQQSTFRKIVSNRTGDIISRSSSTQKTLTPALTLRYCFTF
jgi:hypothetical protein